MAHFTSLAFLRMINPLSQRFYQSTGNIIPMLEETSVFSANALHFRDISNETWLNFGTISQAGDRR